MPREHALQAWAWTFGQCYEVQALSVAATEAIAATPVAALGEVARARTVQH